MTTDTIDRAKLSELLTASSYKQGSLAKAAGISRTYLNEIISGKKQPSKPVIAGLANALNVEPSDLGYDAVFRDGVWKT